MPARQPTEPRGPVKMRDIARIAEVSIATVSRVLHNSSAVDEATAERVREVIRQTNYVPNATGPALKSGRSGLFGLVVPDLSNPFFADLVAHFEQQIVERDQDVLLAVAGHSPEQMSRCVHRMLRRGVEGIVMLESELETRHYETVLHNRVPLVTLNRLQLEPGVSDVAIDTTDGMTAAVAHLRELGHRQIAFFGGRPGQRIASARADSFREAMRRNDLPLAAASISDASFRFDGGWAAMQALLARRPGPAQRRLPTAVICANDLSAMGALRAMTEHGLVAGKDLSLIGLDDLQISSMLTPQLTTLCISRGELARLFLLALDELRTAPHSPGLQYLLHATFVQRDTTGPVPAPAAGSQRKRH